MKRSTEPSLTKFHKWLIDNRYSNRQFAERMAQHLGIDRFSERTVEKWRYGAIPSPPNIAAIKAITGGEVTAETFAEEHA